MPQKRKIHPPGSQIAQSKRTRYANGDNGTSEDATSKAQVDPTYGQRSAFPGLDDPVEEDVLFYGPASDGLEYLRMVRSEAKGVPNLLTATKPDEENDLYQDYPQAYYSDGAYVAASLPSAPGNDTRLDADDDVEPQEAYYTSLLTHFHALSSNDPRYRPDQEMAHHAPVHHAHHCLTRSAAPGKHHQRHRGAGKTP
ncbi:MAG: hypothetical protein Q9197_002984 [Variospora fuerteventurae]